MSISSSLRYVQQIFDPGKFAGQWVRLTFTAVMHDQFRFVISPLSCDLSMVVSIVTLQNIIDARP